MSADSLWPPSGNLDAYSHVIDSGVTRLPSGRLCAFITAAVKEPGYDIPPTEDMIRTFEPHEEARARQWVEDRARKIETQRA